MKVSLQRKIVLIAVITMFGSFVPSSAHASDTVSWSNNDGVQLCANGVMWLCAIRLASPQVSIQYHAQAVDLDTGQVIPQSSSFNVHQGQRLQFTFSPNQSSDISWFGTGWSFDSPYGVWAAGAQGSESCSGQDYVQETVWWGYIPVDQYIQLAVNPPTRSFTSSSNLSCTGDGTTYTCTAVGSGAASANLTFGSTYGQYYGAFVNPYWYGTCQTDGQPMQQFYGGFYDNWDMYTWWVAPSRSAYTMNVPAQTVAYTMSVAPNAPSCSVVLSPNPAPYQYNGTATLTWTATNADYTVINNATTVTGTGGSFSVQRQHSSDYSCTAYNSSGSFTSPATLTVTPPAAPASIITSSLGTAMRVGQSATITATFPAGSGDAITADNIDSPVGTGLGANTNPDASKTITFAPASTGTYTFYARATTQYFTSWATYGTPFSINVSPPPTCTQDGVTLQDGTSAPFYSQQSVGAGLLCSSVSQSRTCNAGTLSGNSTYQYSSCTCAPSTVYTCSADVHTITTTTTTQNCTVSPTQLSCPAPSFCSGSTSSCLWPPPSFIGNGGNLTGHLQALPSLVPQNLPTTLYWKVANVSNCSITGNGATLSGASSGPNGIQTDPITQQTTFTLTCPGLDGSTVNETQVVNILPVFQER